MPWPTVHGNYKTKKRSPIKVQQKQQYNFMIKFTKEHVFKSCLQLEPYCRVMDTGMPRYAEPKKSTSWTNIGEETRSVYIYS